MLLLQLYYVYYTIYKWYWYNVLSATRRSEYLPNRKEFEFTYITYLSIAYVIPIIFIQSHISKQAEPIVLKLVIESKTIITNGMEWNKTKNEMRENKNNKSAFIDWINDDDGMALISSLARQNWLLFPLVT